MLAAALVIMPAALWATADPVGVVKWTLLIIAAITLGGALVLAHLERGVTEIQVGRGVAVTFGAFLAAVLVVTALSESGWLALIGEYTYYQGTLTFVALSIVMMTVVSMTRDPLTTLLRATTAGAGLVAVLTAGQFVGIDWVGYDARMFGRVVTTLGNSNFGAAFLALTLPVILHQVFFGSRSDLERWLSAGVAAVVALETVLIGSVQGPATAIIAVAAWAALVSLARFGARRTVAALAGFAVVGAVAVVALWSRIYTEISAQAPCAPGGSHPSG